MSVRPSRLRELADLGRRRRAERLNLLASPGRRLPLPSSVSCWRVWVWVGWVRDASIFCCAIPRSFHIPIFTVILHGFSFALASCNQLCDVIIGEVVPKNLALEKADRVAVLAAPALLVFYRLSQPLIVVIERSADLILRLLGLKKGTGHGGHSPEVTEVCNSIEPPRRPFAAV